MNLEDKQFDDFLNAKFGQKQFEFKDQYWHKANKMIQASRGANSSVIITASVAIVAVVSIVASILFSQQSSVANQNTASASFTVPSQNVLLASADNGIPSSSNNAATNDVSNNISNQHNEAVASVEPQNASSKQASTPTVKPRKPLGSRKNMITETASKPENIDEVITTKEQQRIIELTTRIFNKNRNTPTQTEQAQASNAYLKYISPRQRLFVLANAGLTIQNGINVNSSLVAGYYIQPKLAITAGVGYARLNQQLGARVYNEVALGFGQDVKQTSITTQSLDYLLLPVALQYDVCAKHHLSGGAQLGYVLQSSDLVERNNAGQTATTENGYLNAINRTDLQLMAAYRFDCTPKLSISAAYHYGLRDISNNQIFNNNTFNRNQFISLSLGYTLY